MQSLRILLNLGLSAAGLGIGFLAWRWLRELDPDLVATIREARRLRKTDPAAAERLLTEFFGEARREEEERRAALRSRAATDLDAAVELRGKLEETLASYRLARDKAFTKLPKAQLAGVRTVLEQHEQQIIVELAALARTIERLKR